CARGGTGYWYFDVW
nr:immunoglobulin heavy chain junction region [Mus musculus]